MQRWRGLAAVPACGGPSAVTIGVFDGVHRGHRALIAATVEAARGRGIPVVVVTIDPHPVEVLRPQAAPARLSTLEHRLDLLAEQGVDATLVLPFTAELSQWSPEEFAHRILADCLHAGVVVVGEDFRFGHRAAGDVAALRRLGAAYGFDVQALALLADDAGRVSSTAIRAHVAAGEMQAAAAALGRLHRVEGRVVHGDHRGRGLGYPTANLDSPPRTAIPADGIYAGYLTHRGGRMPAAISVGTNPTFDGTLRRVEAHVLDRDDLELYGQHVAADFAARLRATLRFESVDELVEQMRHDVDRARALTT